jgi:hypothetical protein
MLKAMTEYSESKHKKRVRKVLINASILIAVGIVTYLLFSTIEKNKVIAQKDKKILMDSMTIVAKVKELNALKVAYQSLEQEREELGLAKDSLIDMVSNLTNMIDVIQEKDSINNVTITKLNSLIKNAKITLVKEKEEVSYIEKTNQVVEEVVITNKKQIYKSKTVHEIVDMPVIEIDRLVLEPLTKKGRILNDHQYDAKLINNIRVNFTIPKNPLTTKVERIFTVQLIEPDGKPYKFNPDFDFITYNNHKVHLTNKKRIAFDGNETHVSFLYPKCTPFKPGLNTVQVFYENKLMAENTIVLH